MSDPTRQYLEQLGQLGPVGQWARDRIITLTLEKLTCQQQVDAAQASIRQLEQRMEQLQKQAHRQAAGVPPRGPRA
jgi:hypothetical protein